MTSRTIRLIAVVGAVLFTGVTFAVAVGFMNGMTGLVGDVVGAHPMAALWAGVGGVVAMLTGALVQRWRRRRAAASQATRPRRPPPP